MLELLAVCGRRNRPDPLKCHIAPLMAPLEFIWKPHERPDDRMPVILRPDSDFVGRSVTYGLASQ